MLGVLRHEFVGHPVQELLGFLGLVGYGRSWMPQDRVIIHFRKLSLQTSRSRIQPATR